MSLRRSLYTCGVCACDRACPVRQLEGSPKFDVLASLWMLQTELRDLDFNWAACLSSRQLAEIASGPDLSNMALSILQHPLGLHRCQLIVSWPGHWSATSGRLRGMQNAHIDRCCVE